MPPAPIRSWERSGSSTPPLLSRPVDLTALVSLSQTSPDDFYEDDTLSRMVKILLNAESDKKADKDTRLDVLTILSNLAASSEGKRRDDIREALDGVNDFMERYLEKESSGSEPELHKLMLLLLARCFEYSIKTEDLLELCRGPSFGARNSSRFARGRRDLHDGVATEAGTRDG